MNTPLLETAKVVWLWRILYHRYCLIEKWLQEKYINSQIHKLSTTFYKGIKISFRYSFLGKITELEYKDNSQILDNSKFILWLINEYKIWKNRVTNYSMTSAFFASTQEIKKELYYLPIKTLSIILVVAILTNIFFSLLFKKEIVSLGWAMRLFLLIIGLGGLFCNADREGLKQSSLILKYINR